MKQFNWRKLATVTLIITLVLGILSSAFGVTVVAITAKPEKEEAETETLENGTVPEGTLEDVEIEKFEFPTLEFPSLGNDLDLKNDVVVLSENDSKGITSSVIRMEAANSYSYGDHLLVTLEGEHAFTDTLRYGNVFFIRGSSTDPLGGRFFEFKGANIRGGQTVIAVKEPYFEDVFESLEMCLSDTLTQANFVKAYYANGVTSHFGNVETEIPDALSDDGVLRDRVEGGAGGITPLANNISTESADLIVTIDYDMGKALKDEGEKESAVETTFGIKGQFGIRDLTAHVVCDMPSVANFKELYFGVSGETFIDVDIYGKVSAKAEMEASSLDLGLVSLEGLNEKRFPLAVFEFKGQTPVKISNAAFDGRKESVIPSLFLVLYSDWEGKIELELTTGFSYAESFNNGLRLFKNGDPCLSFEEYPYVKAYDVESEDGFVWDAEIHLQADADVTLLGGSLLFYIAGVNLCEFSVARIGAQAKCDVSIYADSKGKTEVLEPDKSDFYLRGYLKIIEVKAKIKADGKSFLSGLSIDLNFEFALLDLTLFEFGNRPNKYKPKVPISSMKTPDEFDSVITLVFDVSGSMDSRISTGETKLQAAKSASQMIVNSAKSWSSGGGVYGLGVIQFASYATTVTVPHVDYKYIGECIDLMNDGGGTSIYSGIDAGVSQLENVKAKSKVIILMTDGQDGNTSASRNSAKVAAEKGIKIFTVGFGNDVDEDILTEIASTTGGEYRFANTESVMSIIGSFLYAQQASEAKVLKEVEGAVGQGETSDPSYFTVKEGNGDLTVTTAWPGSFLDTILIDPEGVVVDENYPGAVTDESQIPSTITVKNPLEGQWELKVKGVETSYEKEPFYTIVSFKEGEKVEEILILNEEMEDMEVLASYCIAIGLFTTLASAVLLFGMIRKKPAVPVAPQPAAGYPNQFPQQ